MTNPLPLDLIMVEDSAIDTELVECALQQDGLVVAIRRVEDEPTFRAALEKRLPDAILADWTLPNFSGQKALEIARERCPAVPFLFVSGTISEASALAALRHGAVDYILKHELQRLAPSLTRALDKVQTLRELAEAQRHLLQSDKLAAIGQLAAGIAHEINNPIGFVSSNLGSLENYVYDIFAVLDAYETAATAGAMSTAALAQARKIGQQKDINYLRTDTQQLISESQEGLLRVRNIVRDLKSFAHLDENDWKWADLHSGLESTLNIVWNELKYHCTVHKDFGDLPEIWCLPGQLNQVFMNLLVNAGQAIPTKGDITIRTGRQGKEVFVVIADTGSGITPEHLAHLFEPFFTTKPVGQGTGLGLSLSHNIVQNHHGRIEVESTVGTGTTFTVWLPINSRAVTDGSAAAPTEPTFPPG